MSKYIIKNCPAIYEYGKGLCCNDLKFDEGLAQMINELWQDFTPEEKQQVKGILE